MGKQTFRLGLLFGITLALLPYGRAQVRSTGVVLGTVTDTSGAVIPGATVTLKNIDTGSTITSETNVNGDYSFPSCKWAGTN